MNNHAVDIAEAVLAELEGGSFSLTFAAERAYSISRDLTDDLLRVVVTAPLAVVHAKDLARRLDWDWTIAVYLRKRVGPTTAEVDPLVLLGQEIVAAFADRPLEGTRARNIAVEFRPVYDPEALDVERVFTSQILLTYRITS